MHRATRTPSHSFFFSGSKTVGREDLDLCLRSTRVSIGDPVALSSMNDACALP